MLHLWRRKHQSVFLLAGFGTAVVAGLLYLETRTPVYLQGTSDVHFGLNALPSDADALAPFVSFWPFASVVHDWITRAISQPDATNWAWQATNFLMFSLLNVIGIPLLTATAVYLTSKRSWRVFGQFNFLIFSAVATSIGFALSLKAGNDTSFGEVILPHTRWYLFPFAGVVLWRLGRSLQKRFAWPAAAWISLASAALVAGLLYRIGGPPSPLTLLCRQGIVAIKAQEWPAFVYLREHTPPDSVILTNRYSNGYNFVVSGLTGRAAYLEAHGNNPVEELALRLNPRDDRAAIIKALWSAGSDDWFCSLLRSTPITHVLEFANDPLPAHPPSCLTRLWENQEHTVIVWQVIRTSHF